jgi:hypothetical protein
VSDLGSAIRRGVLDRYAAKESGAEESGAEESALADPCEVVAELVWRLPAVHNALGTAAAIREAEALGLIASGALTGLGRALLADDGMADAADRLIPPSTGKARLQADLTAVVSGLPSAELSALLDLTADADERDTASVWRFSPASVRRALDQGATASRCSATSRRSPRATCRSR